MIIAAVACVVWFGGLIALTIYFSYKNKMRIGRWQSALRCACGCVDMRSHIYNSPCPRCGERREEIVVARMNCGKVEVKS